MMDCMFILTRILFISCCFLTVHCAQPNCTSVADFDDCPGNITDFCPEYSVCACKDGKPFCKCPNFRGQWGNYWYMGAKCDQLWNTLDLILVAVLPGISLALIVGVTIQTIYYCKKKSKKNINDHREQRSLSGLQAQHNSAHVFNTAMRPSPDQGQSPWSSSPQSVFPRIPVSQPQQFFGRNYNIMTHEPKEDNPYIQPFYNWDGSLGTTRPESSSTPGVQSQVTFKERQQIGYLSSEEPELPYRIGHLQMKPNY